MSLMATNIWVQLISTTCGSLGFAILFRIKGRSLAWTGVGAFFTWAVYALTFTLNKGMSYNGNNFVSTIAGAIFVAGFAQIMARVNKAPATIFLAATAFPLIPGPNLYYMMYELVMGNNKLAWENAIQLIETCLGIALGFLVIEIVNKYAIMIYAPFKKRKREKKEKLKKEGDVS